MIEQILIGRGKAIREISRDEWEREIRRTPEPAGDRLGFMTADHHRVRRMAVIDLARQGRPLEPEYFAEQLDLSPVRVGEILGDLERRLFFLVRNPEGAVSWAYPLTVARTPHRLTFSTGERLYGA